MVLHDAEDIASIEEKEKAIYKATEEYQLKVEKSVNKPIEVILKNAGFANLNDIVIAYRDAGEQALERMKEGASGKTLTEKPKSSKYGIALSGYIPINQSFGKAGASGQTERFNDKVKHRFEDQEYSMHELNSILAELNKEPSKPITKETQEKIDKILSSNPVAKDVIKTKEGYEVSGLVDEKVMLLLTLKQKNLVFFTKKMVNFLMKELMLLTKVMKINCRQLRHYHILQK